MLLKRLELTGFKSFADKTVLDFTEGSTAVVGPNGSGKSNISDAIRWVIGEMSAKQLRGSNMQDVIFAGTEDRRPVNYAEVSLVLDNSTRIFNIDYDELVVTRRLFRSGESVYQINRAACRLKDIHELFMDTGLGRDGYSIIGQGNVSQILSTKAEDRRSLFEEAAGISKYKYRKEEALRKLKGVEENLVRISDITAELESQRAPLKRQSEKARKYLTYYEEYKGLDVNTSLITIEKNKAQLEKNASLKAAAEEELSLMRAEESETEAKIAKLYEGNKALDAEIAAYNARLLENENAVSSAKSEISIAENNIKNNNAMLGRIDGDISAIKEKNTARERDIAKYAGEIRVREAEEEKLISELDTASSSRDDITMRQEEIAAGIEKLREETAEKLNDIASKKAQMSAAEAMRQSYIDRRAVLETEIKSARENAVDTEKSIEECRTQISENTAKLDKMNETIKRLEERLDKSGRELSDINEQLTGANVEYNSKASKKKILEGMENDYAGYSKSVKTVLKADKLRRLAVYGTVSGLIDVTKEYVTAIEMALGGALQNIVVESEEDAKAAISYLRENKAGRATFLPVTSVKGRELENIKEITSCEGVIGAAHTLVKYNKKYDGVIKSLLGRVVVVDNIDNAIKLCRRFGYKFRAVTTEGDILNAGGSMSGGSVNKQSGFLSRAAEIKSLTSELKTLMSKIRGLNESKRDCSEIIATLEKQLGTYTPLAKEYSEELIRLEAAQKHLTESLEAGGELRRGYEEESVDIEKRLAESSEEIGELLSGIRALEKETDALKESEERLGGEYDEITAQREERSKGIMDKTMQLAAIQKDINVIRNASQTAENEIKASLEEIKRHEAEKDSLRETNDSLYREINDKNALTEELKIKSEEINGSISDAQGRKRAISVSLEEIQGSNRDLTDRLLNLQQEISRFESREEKLAGDNDSILSRLWDSYEMTYSDAESARTEVADVKAANARLKELRAEIKSLGSVNVDAIEEYIAVEERFKFLSEQKNDLDKSKADLNGIISSMEELMQEHFEKQFAEINRSFGEVFRELFGGGRGRLYLSEPDDVLESGIEIEVQLPGKGLQNINLYSGGEKSFIAIALLFAILRVKPAPFCILDEIDAALDDANVSRFATYLKNYTDQSQFIVITHRRGTMEAANILYGVTMQEKGVSKLLSLHIDDVDENMAE